jgi:SsrA-binding protein
MINIKNKKAYYEFQILNEYIAGIQLVGSEIKSIRDGKVSLGEAYCFFRKEELWIKGLHISEYTKATHYNHEPLRLRKLLLKKRELRKLHSKIKERGYTIVALRLFISERGLAKVEIGLAKGKKIHDKRESIKQKDLKRDWDRTQKW